MHADAIVAMTWNQFQALVKGMGIAQAVSWPSFTALKLCRKTGPVRLGERPLLDIVAHFGSAVETYRRVSVWNSFQSAFGSCDVELRDRLLGL